MKLRLTSGFDGYIPDPEPGDTPNSLLDQCDYLDATAAEAQIDQAFEYMLCPKCRNAIAIDPLQQAGAHPGSHKLQ